MNTVFDADYGHMYRAWVFPDLYPEERQPVLKNWLEEDIADFCELQPQ